jgi:hypothetical protein
MYRHPQPPIRSLSLGGDEAHLPQGECRYLLLHPEVRGQRCACVGFSLNRSTPGSSCDCGHQACYHLSAKDDRPSEREEIEALKQKVLRLEEVIEREGFGLRSNLASRLSDLEELVDKCKADMEFEIKTAYRGIEGLWHNIGSLQRRARAFDDRIDSLVDTNQDVQDDVRALQKRVIEVDDATMLLEERIDASLSPNTIASSSSSPTSASAPRVNGEQPPPQLPNTEDKTIAKTWTVHVSLLPMASQPFPFEKDTQKYKRCLSRGLHRIVAVPGTDSKSFTETISNEFSSLLKGRCWMPLVAKICDAENLRGLPMLRQLPPSQIDEQFYDIDFLKKNCATLDANGNILDLYIAMRTDTFSWAELKQAPPFMIGLEACWDYDPIVDGPRVEDDASGCKEVSDNTSNNEEKSSAGDILRAWSPTTKLKRTASAVSRTSSFGSATEGETKRAKIQRPWLEQRLSVLADEQKLYK